MGSFPRSIADSPCRASDSKRSRAAATVVSMSAGVPSGMAVHASPVYGNVTSNHSPLPDGTVSSPTTIS